MRRKYFGLALAAIATLGSTGVWQSTGLAGDREIAEQIIQKLRDGRDAGKLKDFKLDMKVDDGVVLFRGNVIEAAQKKLVLESVSGIEGIANVVDEVSVSAKKPAAIVAEKTPGKRDGFSFRDAVAKTAASMQAEIANSGAVAGAPDDVPAPIAVAPIMPQLELEPFASTDSPLMGPEIMPGEIATTAGAAPLELSSDKVIAEDVIRSLSEAQRSGELRGFGIDVKVVDGVAVLTGKARSDAQRKLIVSLAGQTAGVDSVQSSIKVIKPIQPVSNLESLNFQPPVQQDAPAQMVSGSRVMSAPYRMNQGVPTQAAPVSNVMAQPVGAPMGAPVMGQPVPMGGYNGAAGPRYDQPYLPNYAWPGYAAYPNYAAVTYPQQYSPSAFPYIGPFYPYPQVPLGWRRVSLEWDDGWWNLDFTDR